MYPKNGTYNIPNECAICNAVMTETVDRCLQLMNVTANETRKNHTESIWKIRVFHGRFLEAFNYNRQSTLTRNSDTTPCPGSRQPTQHSACDISVTRDWKQPVATFGVTAGLHPSRDSTIPSSYPLFLTEQNWVFLSETTEISPTNCRVSAVCPFQVGDKP